MRPSRWVSSNYEKRQPPGASQTRPAAINNRGQIAGEYVDRAGTSHGYLQDRDGSVTTIDPSGAGATVVTGVDDRGRVVGASVDQRLTAISAFVRDPDEQGPPHRLSRAQETGISALMRVPRSGALSTSRRPLRASTRAARPRRPEPRPGSAPPMPSSRTVTVA
jgi:hypothetical protein